MTYVLDACAIIAMLRNEAGAEITEQLLLEQTCIAHAVNLCEVYYDFLKAENESIAREAISDLETWINFQRRYGSRILAGSRFI
jgi:PIN domain nuclease of toxin-antitoxin system